MTDFENFLNTHKREIERLASFANKYDDALKIARSLALPDISFLTDQLNAKTFALPTNLLDQIKLAEEAANPLRKEIDRINEFIKPFHSQPSPSWVFSELNLLAKFKEIDALKNQILGNYAFHEFKNTLKSYDNNFPEFNYRSFTPNIFQEIQGLLDQDEGEFSESSFNEISREIDDHFNNLPKNRISSEGRITILLAIFFFLANYYFAEANSKKQSAEYKHISQKIDQLNENISTQNSKTEVRLNSIEKYLKALLEKVTQLETEKEKSSQLEFYIVERVVELHIKPNKKSELLIVLYPNQRVQLHKRKGKWIYVEFFDYISGIPRTGWVLKKYLKRQP